MNSIAITFGTIIIIVIIGIDISEVVVKCISHVFFMVQRSEKFDVVYFAIYC